MKKYQVFYRQQGNPNADIFCKLVKAFDFEMAEMFAYSDISENYTIVGIVEE